ncbi:MAG: hypothetical protein M4579_000796 [Chaenotheca gracillima]|nr:MAG: hypothetical protein M4579_000796 [Chaenotheca gracillima]
MSYHDPSAVGKPAPAEYSQTSPHVAQYQQSPVQQVPQAGYNQQMQATPPVDQGYHSPAPQGGYVAPQQHEAYPQNNPPVATIPGHGPVQDWHESFWDCCSPSSTCCMGYWCPCVLFGRTYDRLEDPTLANHSAFNMNCLGCCVIGSCGFGWVLQMMKRGDLRRKYNLDGSGLGDCIRPYCCPCCTIIQEEKEVVWRTKGAGANIPPQGYQAPTNAMTYGK